MNSDQHLDRLFANAPYSLCNDDKQAILTPRLRALTRLHYERCEPYRNIINRVFGGESALDFDRIEESPFLPVSLFKTRELRSVDSRLVVKTLTSSGTTGQAVSRIFLDAETAQLQSRALVKIMQHFLGVDRRPLIFLDHPSVMRDRRTFSARAAGILGMLPFGRRPLYALHDDLTLDIEAIDNYLQQAHGQPPVLFGFTFMIWQYFVTALERLGRRLFMPGAILLHSGGWKKLETLMVGPKEFRERVRALTGVDQVVNYYGMVEQVGSVYLENSLHFLHASVFSDVIIRDPNSLAPMPPGEPGLIQVVSALPSSYPGQSLLTEDMGVIEGCDDARTGMRGKFFRMIGRLPKADLRGCSDTFQARDLAPALAQTQ